MRLLFSPMAAQAMCGLGVHKLCQSAHTSRCTSMSATLVHLPQASSLLPDPANKRIGREGPSALSLPFAPAPARRWGPTPSHPRTHTGNRRTTTPQSTQISTRDDAATRQQGNDATACETVHTVSVESSPRSFSTPPPPPSPDPWRYAWALAARQGGPISTVVSDLGPAYWRGPFSLSKGRGQVDWRWRWAHGSRP